MTDGQAAEDLDAIRSVSGLCRAVQGGLHPDYLFFWGSFVPADGSVGPTCLSQWYVSPFELDGTVYRTAEHFMMAEKARLFGDESALARILRSRFPAEVKKFGREVKGFEEQRWQDCRLDIVIRGNIAKFVQHTELGTYLKGTAGTLIVEASPADAVWGIGVAEEHPYAVQPRLWPGLNLLGFALMEVRSRLLAEAQSTV